MRSYVAAPVAVISSLLLSALSVALQRGARRLAVYSLLSAALCAAVVLAKPRWRIIWSVWLPFSLSQSMRLDLHYHYHYQLCIPNCALRFKPQNSKSQKLQEKGRGQQEQTKSRGLLRYADGATRTAACAATKISGSEQCTEMHRWLGGCLDGCLGS
jgi:hypothetical protein